jgi:hypothetical protein
MAAAVKLLNEKHGIPIPDKLPVTRDVYNGFLILKVDDYSYLTHGGANLDLTQTIMTPVEGLDVYTDEVKEYTSAIEAAIDKELSIERFKYLLDGSENFVWIGRTIFKLKGNDKPWPHEKDISEYIELELEDVPWL